MSFDDLASFWINTSIITVPTLYIYHRASGLGDETFSIQIFYFYVRQHGGNKFEDILIAIPTFLFERNEPKENISHQAKKLIA